MIAWFFFKFECKIKLCISSFLQQINSEASRSNNVLGPPIQFHFLVSVVAETTVLSTRRCRICMENFYDRLRGSWHCNCTNESLIDSPIALLYRDPWHSILSEYERALTRQSSYEIALLYRVPWHSILSEYERALTRQSSYEIALLYRDPWDSILSEYERALTRQSSYEIALLCRDRWHSILLEYERALTRQSSYAIALLYWDPWRSI